MRIASLAFAGRLQGASQGARCRLLSWPETMSHSQGPCFRSVSAHPDEAPALRTETEQRSTGLTLMLDRTRLLFSSPFDRATRQSHPRAHHGEIREQGTHQSCFANTGFIGNCTNFRCDPEKLEPPRLAPDEEVRSRTGQLQFSE